MVETSEDRLSKLKHARIICAKIDLPRFCHHCSIVLKGTVNLWRSQVDILYVNRFETDLDQKAPQAVFAVRGH